MITRRLILLLCLFTLEACNVAHYNVPIVCDVAIDKDGVAEDYTFDMSKPKVMTYFGTLDIFESWLKGCSPQKLQEYKDQYPGFEFIFYLRVLGDAELKRALALVNKYRVETPTYIDAGDKYRRSNIDPGCILVSSIVGGDNKYYGCAVLGMKLSPFDEVMRDAVKRIKEDRNGL